MRRRLRCPTCEGNPTTTQKLDWYDERGLYANSYDHWRIGKDNYDAVLLPTGLTLMANLLIESQKIPVRTAACRNSGREQAKVYPAITTYALHRRRARHHSRTHANSG
jgi:hypothetical protein